MKLKPVLIAALSFNFCSIVFIAFATYRIRQKEKIFKPYPKAATEGCNQPCDMHQSGACPNSLACVYSTSCNQAQFGGHCCRNTLCQTDDDCVCGPPPTITPGGPTLTPVPPAGQNCKAIGAKIAFTNLRAIHTGGQYGVSGSWHKQPDCLDRVRIRVCQCDGLQEGCEISCQNAGSGGESSANGTFTALLWPESYGGACGTIQVDGFFEPNNQNSGFIVQKYQEPCRQLTATPTPTKFLTPTPTSFITPTATPTSVFSPTPTPTAADSPTPTPPSLTATPTPWSPTTTPAEQPTPTPHSAASPSPTPETLPKAGLALPTLFMMLSGSFVFILGLLLVW